MSGCREISAEEFERALATEFASGAFAQRRPFPWSDGMPLALAFPTTLEAYGAVVLPWWGEPRDLAGQDGYAPEVIPVRFDWLSSEPIPIQLTPNFHGVLEAYRYFGKLVPTPLTIEQWFRDFDVPDSGGFFIPADVAEILDRHTAEAAIVYASAAFAEHHHWTIDRSTLFQAPENDPAIPASYGIIELFPRGGHWYLVYDDDRPLLNLGGSRALLAELARALGDRFFPRALSDPLYL